MTQIHGDFKELLTRAGLSKAELARRLALNSRTVTGWGNNPPLYAVAYLELLIEWNRVRP